jgi:outer membrane lipoprotein
MLKISTQMATLAAFIVLTGCAGDSHRQTMSERVTTPNVVSANPVLHQGKTVEWGGMLVTSRNLKDRTELEILALPLRDNGRPDREGRPLGRFVAVHPGYLETADYRPGNLITIAGRIIGYQDGRVGEKAYRYPKVLIDESRFWRNTYYRDRPDVRVGVGVGSWGSGVSVGIGF